VQLRDARENGRKRQHKEAMKAANGMCETLKQQLLEVKREAEKLVWERRKHRNQVATDKEALEISKWGVERKEAQMERKADNISRRGDLLVGKEIALRKKRDKIEYDKEVRSLCPLQFFIRLLSFA
jgi:hypothetical protein